MSNHHTSVDALLERAGNHPSPERQLEVFEAAFNAIWRRAQITLGDVTLMAIVKRVLHRASETYPALSAIQVSAAGIGGQDLALPLSELNPQQREAAIRFVLVELLTVIGVLTAEILTPALHGALGAVDFTQGAAPGDASDEPNARSQ